MKYILILIGLFLVIVGASECNQSAPTLTYKQERDTVPVAELRVTPGSEWIKWGVNDGDSITLNGFALMSQNSVNSQERIITDTAFREWVASWVSDSVTITGYPDSSAVYDSLAAHLALILANTGSISTNGDSITTHRSEINDILDSLVAHRTDIDNSGGGGGGSTDIVVIPDYDSLRNYTATDLAYVSNFTGMTDGDTAITVGGLFYKSTGGTEDGAVTIVGSATWKRFWDETNVKPEWWEIGGYDADGVDYTSINSSSAGIYNESDRLRSAARLGGTGVDYYVQLQPLKTYEIDLPLPPCLIKGGFATIKNKREYQSALTAQASSGQANVTVSDASGFRVGQYIVIADISSSTGGKGYTHNNYQLGEAADAYITGISGNTITLSENLTVTMDIGDIMSNLQPMCRYSSGDKNIVFRDLVIDGNRRSDQASQDWRVGDVVFGSTQDGNITLENCTVKNTRGSGLKGANIRINGGSWTSTGGGVIHQSDASSDDNGFVWIQNVFMDSIGIFDTDTNSHEEAIFVFSANSSNVFIDNVKANNVFNAVFGNVELSQDYNIRVTNSIFTGGDDGTDDDVSPQYIFRADLTGDPLESSDIILDNNEFVNLGDIVVLGDGINDVQARGIKITNNKFVNCRIYMIAPHNVDIIGNEFIELKDFSGFARLCHAESGNGRSAFIYLNAPNYCRINENKIVGDTFYNEFADYGIHIQRSGQYWRDINTGSNTLVYKSSHIEIKENTITGVTYGIGHLARYFDANSTYNSPANDGYHIGWNIDNNFIHLEKNAQTTSGTSTRFFWGIEGSPGFHITNNKIFLPDSNQIYGVPRGILITGLPSGLDTTLMGATIMHNQIFTRTSSEVAIDCALNAGQDRNNIVAYNIYQGALQDTSNSFNIGNIFIGNGFEGITDAYVIPDVGWQ